MLCHELQLQLLIFDDSTSNEIVKFQSRYFIDRFERNNVLFLNFRSEFEQGDQVIMHNIKKAKRLPGTKEAKKYLGPYTIEEVTPSHLVARKDPHSKTTKLPIHMSRKYHSQIQ